jgi:uncharacterized protein (DUF1778 family)
MIATDMQQRTAILIRCTRAEAELIRRAARAQRRTISGFILNAIMTRLQARVRVVAGAHPPKPNAEPQP